MDRYDLTQDKVKKQLTRKMKVTETTTQLKNKLLEKQRESTKKQIENFIRKKLLQEKTALVKSMIEKEGNGFQPTADVQKNADQIIKKYEVQKLLEQEVDGSASQNFSRMRMNV